MISLLLAAAVCISAAPSRPVVYMCPKVSAPPTVNGLLDDDAWKNAPEVSFIHSEDGAPVTRQTTAKMCWDDKNLYVSFNSIDPVIWSTMTKRDDALYTEDVVEVFLNPTCDLTHYYEFEFSPKNTILDLSVIYDNLKHSFKGNFPWNCDGIQSAIDQKANVGWTTEVAIPFASMNRTTPKPGERWRGNIYRIDYEPKPAEYQAWSPTLKNPASFHVPERFGTIFFTNAE